MAASKLVAIDRSSGMCGAQEISLRLFPLLALHLHLSINLASTYIAQSFANVNTSHHLV